MEEKVREKITEYGNDIMESENMKKGKQFHHHGKRSVYDHTLEVVEWSIILARRFHLKVNEEAMVRGALLHDFYQYDWHKPSPNNRWHGFTHPGTAYRNACKEFSVTELEKNIILRHMFPLTLVPPTTKEAWIVCAADKIAAVHDYTNQWGR